MINRDRSRFFFIHTFKNMGTTIYKCLPENYNKRFYGLKTISQWEVENGCKIKNKNKNQKISFDHITIDELVELKILNIYDINYRDFLGLVREPTDRFISICNFTNYSPDEVIKKIRFGEFFNEMNLPPDMIIPIKQSESFKTKYNIKLTLIPMQKKEEIKKWFLKFNININFDEQYNVSNKKYSINDLSDKNIQDIREIFNDDYVLYNKLINNQ